MPLYNLEQFKELVVAKELYCFNKRMAYRTMDSLNWEEAELHRMLLGLLERDFQKTVPRCAVNDLDDYDFLDADQYSIYWNEEEGRSKAEPGSGTVCLSLKIAIVDDELGTCAGIVTFHSS